MRAARSAIAVLALALAAGCNFTSDLVRVEDRGTYACAHPDPRRPDHRLDTGAPTTRYVHGLGVPAYVEFVDLDTGEVVQLLVDADLGWRCEPEGEER